MSSLKDQIAENIRKKRERPEEPGQSGRPRSEDAGSRFDAIRPSLAELAHATDQYSLKVDFPVGPYEEIVAVLELKDARDTWVASWQVGTTVSDPVHDWEVAYNPRGIDVRRKWFANTEALFGYLTTSIAERVVEMDDDEG